MKQITIFCLLLIFGCSTTKDIKSNQGKFEKVMVGNLLNFQENKKPRHRRGLILCGDERSRNFIYSLNTIRY